MKYWEDYTAGEHTALGSHTITEAEILAFARKYDPQPFHLDEAAAACSHFGALCASGWHTAAVWAGLMVEHQRRGNPRPLDLGFDEAHQCGPRLRRCVMRIDHDDDRRPIGRGRIHHGLRNLQVAGVIGTYCPALPHAGLQNFCQG